MDLTFRTASRRDVTDLFRLNVQLATASPTITPERLAVVLGKIESYPDYRIYLVHAGERLVGTFALLIMDTLGDRCAPAGAIEDVVVDRDARGQGIGREMMRFAMERCREAGCCKMVLSSNLRREEAHRFYESLGFEKHGFSFVVTVD